MSKISKHSPEEWAAHIEAWRATGGTQRKYCRERGLSPLAFSYWRRKIEGGSKQIRAGGMVEVTRPVVSAPLLELRVNQELDVAVQLCIPGELLRSLLS